MRVKVISGDGKRDLGKGTMIARVPVYFVYLSDGTIMSQKDPSKRPALWRQIIATLLGGRLVVEPYNPKILLDTGEYVYGCQVWFTLIDDEPDIPAETMNIHDVKDTF